MAYTGIINPLDLKEILVNYLAGSMNIFISIAIVVLAILAASYRMTNVAFLMLLALFLMLLGGQTLFMLIIIITGLVVGIIISKMIKS